jgi:hypothetical protein
MKKKISFKSAEYFTNIPAGLAEIKDFDEKLLELQKVLTECIEPIILSNPLATLDLNDENQRKLLLLSTKKNMDEYMEWYTRIITEIGLYENNAQKLLVFISFAMNILFSSVAAKNYVYNQQNKGGLKTQQLRIMINHPRDLYAAYKAMHSVKEESNGL